jgi:peptide/nickel transport system permease protein
MIALLIGRLLQLALVLLTVSFAVYGLMGLMPGDPVDLMISADPNLSSEDARRLKALYGLDRPIVERWWHWLSALLQGDPGYSRLYGQPVLEVLRPALLNTALLMGSAIVAALAVAIPLGIWAALRPGSGRDYLINTLAFAGISVPVFWLGLLLIMLFAVRLGWLPAGGSGSEETGLARLRYLVLPALTVALVNMGAYVRYMRAAMIEVMRSDYIEAARAKGCGTARIVLVHALRNALLPLVTLIGLEIGTLFSGALVTETVFAWPGMGKLIYDAIMGNDFNLALVALLLATTLTLLGNLAADLAYGWLDPRIRHR